MFRTASPFQALLGSLRLRSHPHYRLKDNTRFVDSRHRLRLSIFGLALGCVGGSWALAEDRASSDGTVKKPTRSFYRYLICGGGIAAQEALKVFVDENVASDVLLVSQDWRKEGDQAVEPHTGASSLPGEGICSKILHGIGSVFVPLSSSISGAVRNPEILIGRSVKKIDSASRVAVLDDGVEIGFERCLIAVGSSVPQVPIGKVVSRDAAKLVSGAQSKADWDRIDSIVQQGLEKAQGSQGARPHLTVVGGGWMSTAVGAELVNRGADVTFSYAEPGFMSRYFPKYIAQDILSRLLWASEGGVESLSYAAVRYVIARQPIGEPERSLEAEVHIGTVFDSFSIVDFRTDHVIFAPTLSAPVPLYVTAARMKDGGFLVSPELTVASDVYAAGASLSVGSGAIEYARVMRWSADHARATGRHAALNILGARQPYSYSPSLSVNLDSLRLRVHVHGDLDGSSESFGYFSRSKTRDESTCGGQLEKGVLFCVKPAPLSHRGATQKLHISGVALWDGSATTRIEDLDNAQEAVRKLLLNAPMKRTQLEKAMDNYVQEYLDISLFQDEPRITTSFAAAESTDADAELEQPNEGGHEANEEALPTKPLRSIRKPSPRVIWRRHKSARTLRVRPDELLWVRDEWDGAVSPDTHEDKVSMAYREMLKKAAGA